MTALVVHTLVAALVLFTVLDIAIAAGVVVVAFVVLRFYLLTRGVDLVQWWFVLCTHMPKAGNVAPKPKGGQI